MVDKLEHKQMNHYKFLSSMPATSSLPSPGNLQPPPKSSSKPHLNHSLTLNKVNLTPSTKHSFLNDSHTHSRKSFSDTL